MNANKNMLPNKKIGHKYGGNREKQSGAVLIVALILLIIITLIGISTMGSTSMEVKMAANSQFYNRAFQESEHVIKVTSEDLSLLSKAYTASVYPDAPEASLVVASASADNDYMASESHVEFAGFSQPHGENTGSVRIGASGYSLYNYEIRGEAEIVNAGAKNTNVRGVYILGARPD